jgi:exopolysaccharide biosynthesis polyprenyl glycosylphosphotransferase
LLAPLMLFTALAIRLDSPGPIFYSQVRSGWNGQPFKVYKFRSMHQDAEARGAQWAQERDPRITRVGYWLRILRIDELPQIWNVLCGEMSLIGPRPERPEFDTKLKEVIPYYELRYLVKPGITGWAQVMYPYGASIPDSYDKLAYDLYYIKNYSIWLDVVIVLKTIRVVLLGKGR